MKLCFSESFLFGMLKAEKYNIKFNLPFWFLKFHYVRKTEKVIIFFFIFLKISFIFCYVRRMDDFSLNKQFLMHNNYSFSVRKFIFWKLSVNKWIRIYWHSVILNLRLIISTHSCIVFSKINSWRRFYSLVLPRTTPINIKNWLIWTNLFTLKKVLLI